jgi:hypothetical protein
MPPLEALQSRCHAAIVGALLESDKPFDTLLKFSLFFTIIPYLNEVFGPYIDLQDQLC